MSIYPEIRLRKYSKPNGKVTWFELSEECEVAYDNNILIIPKGYRTDFASVPRLLWSVVPPHGRMSNASVVHDFVYDNRLYEQQYGATAARLLADVTFLIHCNRDGVPTWQAIGFFLLLRMFGKKWWVR